jgi:hypothetical protein
MGMLVENSPVVTGITCDVRGCANKITPRQPLPGYEHSSAATSFGELAMGGGWSRRFVRSIRWYCPAHEANAYRCPDGKWCTPGSHYRQKCPVHGPSKMVSGREYRLGGDTNE